MFRKNQRARTPMLEAGKPPDASNKNASVANEPPGRPTAKPAEVPAVPVEPRNDAVESVDESRTPPKVNKALEPQEDSPFASHCRSDGPIWARYLDESEIEDKELTEIWNNSLDSLLVFAGLFAGILTAFLMESSKELKEDPQEHLLKEILNTLRNTSDTSTFELEQSSLHINVLWFTSLVLSLISALGGVLAKGWLAKYNPATRQVHTGYACERHLRAARAREWQLAPLITAIPLLIQVSLFLFFAGLVIQVSHQDVRIWSIVVLLVGSITLLYIVGTLLPWFSPACPFYTPISDFLPGLAAQSQYRDGSMIFQGTPKAQISWKDHLAGYLTTAGRFWEQVRQKPDKVILQAQILSSLIANSANEETIGEAINVVAGSKRTEELRRALIQAGSRETMYEKLQACVRMIPGLPKETINSLQLESLLYALLQIEQPLAVDAESANHLPYIPLLDEGKCLRRWDDFEPHLHALVFSLRVHILVNCGRDDHREKWKQTKENLDQMASSGFLPHIKRVLFFAALRGFLVERPTLRITCGHVLSKLLFDVDKRRKIRTPASMINTPKEGFLAFEISRIIGQLCGSDDSSSREISTQLLTRCSEYGNLRYLFRMALPEVVRSLRNTNFYVRQDAAAILLKGNLHVEFSGTTPPIMQSLVDLLNGDSAHARSEVVPILTKLAEYIEPRDAIRTIIPLFVNLLEDPNLNVRSETVPALGSLAEHVELRDAIRLIIPCLVNRLEDPEQIIRSRTVDVLGKLAEHVDLRDAIRLIVPCLVNRLEDAKKDIRSGTVDVLGKLAEHVELRDAIRPAISSLVDLFKDGDVRSKTISALEKLAEHVEFQNAIRPVIPLLVDPHLHVESGAVFALGRLAKHVELRDAILAATPSLINLLIDSSSDIKSAILFTVAELAVYAELRDAISRAIPSLADLLKDGSPGVRFSAIFGLEKLSKHISVRHIIPSPCDMLTDDSPDVRYEAVSALEKLPTDVELRDTIRLAIPSLIDLLKDGPDKMRYGVLSVLAKLAQDAELHGTIRSAISSLGDLLKDAPSGVQYRAIGVLAELAKHAELHDAICSGIPFLVGMLESNDDDFRAPGVSIAVKLAKHVGLHDALHPIIPSLVNLLTDDKESVRHEATLLLTKLAKHARLCEAITKTVPALLDFVSNRALAIRIDIFAVIFSLPHPSDLRTAISASILSTCLFSATQTISNPSTLLNIQMFLPEIHQHSSVPTTLANKHTLAEPELSGFGEFRNLLNSKESCKVQIGIRLLYQMAQLFDGATEPIGGVVKRMIDGACEKSLGWTEALLQLFDFAKHPKLLATIPITHLIKAINVHPEAIISALAKLAEHVELHDEILFVISSLGLLGDNSSITRSEDVSVLVKLAEHTKFHSIIRPVIPSLVDLLKDGTSDMALTILSKLAKNIEVDDTILLVIPSLLDSLHHPVEKVRINAVSTLAELAEHTRFYGIIRPVIPSLVDLLEDQNWSIRREAVSALSKLVEHGEVDWFPLKDRNFWAQNEAFSVLSKLAERVELRDSIRPIVLLLVELLKNGDENVRSELAPSLTKIAKHVEFHDAIRPVISLLIQLVDDGSTTSRVRIVFISALLDLANYAELQDTIRPVVTSLINILKDRDSWVQVQEHAILALRRLAEHVELRNAIGLAVPSLVDLLRDHNSSNRHGVALALLELVEHAEFYDTIRPDVPSIVNLLISYLPRYQRIQHLSPTVDALLKLAGHVELYEAIRPAIEPLVDLLKKERISCRSKGVSALLELAKNVKLCETIRSIIPNLVNSLKDNEPKTRTSVASLLADLLSHADYCDIILQHKPPYSWLEHMHDSDADALGAFTAIFCFLVNNDYIHTGVVQAILDAKNALDNPKDSVRKCGAIVLLTMGTHVRLRDILCEVLTIHACIEQYIEGATRQDADMILQRMEYFGILKSL